MWSFSAVAKIELQRPLHTMKYECPSRHVHPCVSYHKHVTATLAIAMDELRLVPNACLPWACFCPTCTGCALPGRIRPSMHIHLLHNSEVSISLHILQKSKKLRKRWGMCRIMFLADGLVTWCTCHGLLERFSSKASYPMKSVTISSA